MMNTQNGTDTNDHNNEQKNSQNNGPNPNANRQIRVQHLAQLFQAFMAVVSLLPQQQVPHAPGGPLTRSQAAVEAWLEEVSYCV